MTSPHIFKDVATPQCPRCAGPMEEDEMTNGGVVTPVWICNRHDDILPLLERLENPIAEKKHIKYSLPRDVRRRLAANKKRVAAMDREHSNTIMYGEDSPSADETEAKHKIIRLGEESQPSDKEIVAWSYGKFFCCMEFNEQGLRDHLSSRMITDQCIESEVVYQKEEIAKRKLNL